MTLSTFGAIVGFAAEMIDETKGICDSLIGKTKNPLLKEALRNLVKDEEKNYALMEKTRRENVTEMILEPITGFEKGDYTVKSEGMPQENDENLIDIVLIYLERERRYFIDASKKVSLPEVAGIFKKMGRKKEEGIQRFKEMKGVSPL